MVEKQANRKRIYYKRNAKTLDNAGTDNNSKIKAYRRAYYQRPEVKAKKKAYNRFVRKHSILIPNGEGKRGEYIYVNGYIEKFKENLPKMLDKIALKLLKEK